MFMTVAGRPQSNGHVADASLAPQLQCVADATLTISFPIHAARLRVAPLLALEVLLAALLLVQGARLAWLVSQPSATPAAAVAEATSDSTVDPPGSHGDLFNRDPSAAVAASGDAGGFRLFGVRLQGSRSGAILGHAGHQRAYLVGDEVAPGIVLADVRDDHVVLRANGRLQRLELPGAQP